MAPASAPITDLTAGSPFGLNTQEVDLDQLVQEISAIASTIVSGISQGGGGAAYELEQLTLTLAISMDGRVFLVARGSSDASITLRVSRPHASNKSEQPGA